MECISWFDKGMIHGSESINEGQADSHQSVLGWWQFLGLLRSAGLDAQGTGRQKSEILCHSGGCHRAKVFWDRDHCAHKTLKVKKSIQQSGLKHSKQRTIHTS
jgi:hypothetical protein